MLLRISEILNEPFENDTTFLFYIKSAPFFSNIHHCYQESSIDEMYLVRLLRTHIEKKFILKKES